MNSRSLINQLSNEKRAPSCLGYIGGYTAQLYGDYISAVFKTLVRCLI